MSENITRKSFLTGTAALGALGLAACSSGGGAAGGSDAAAAPTYEGLPDPSEYPLEPDGADVPVAERPRVPVVRTSPTGSIVWAAGIRADERARCLPGSSVLLELEVRGPMAGPHERR